MMRLAVVWLAGCSVVYEPDVGPLHAQIATAPDGGHVDDDAGPAVVTGSCVDSDPAVAVSFSTHVRPLTTRSPGGCLGCHGSTTTSGFTLGSYESLRRGGTNSGTRIIVPGKPCESIIVQKLGVAPPFGARMPYNGPPFFTAAELTIVKDWIAEGALNN
jgi:hypothetical protein